MNAYHIKNLQEYRAQEESSQADFFGKKARARRQKRRAERESKKAKQKDDRQQKKLERITTRKESGASRWQNIFKGVQDVASAWRAPDMQQGIQDRIIIDDDEPGGGDLSEEKNQTGLYAAIGGGVLLVALVLYFTLNK